MPAFGQTLPDNSGDAQRTGLGTTSKTATSASAENTPNPENNTAEHDDTLYRGKTSDSENPMLRDDGALHFKSRPKERIHEVDSLKNLQSTGTDPKFQGSFITSGVSSIDKVAEKANSIEIGEGGAQLQQTGNPRSVKRHMTFPAEQDEKTDKAKTAADSSPSPTPSPSASPDKKKTSGANR